MSLTRKVVGGWLTLQLLVWGALKLIWSPSILEGYEQFERHDMERDMALARDVLSSQLQNLNGHLNDWAAWDATYDYVVTRDPAYLTENIPGPVTLQDLGLHFLSIRGFDGKPIYQAAISETTANPEYVPFPTALDAHLKPGMPLLNLTTPESRAGGILLIENRIALIVSQPVVTGNHEGPIRGTLTWGRFLTFQDMQELARLTHLKLTIQSVPEVSRQEQLAPYLQELSGLPANATRAFVTESQITGLTLVKDMTGTSGVMLRVDAPRHFYQTGLIRLQEFSRLLLMMMLLSMLVGAVVLRQFVLKRIRSLSSHLKQIGEEGLLSARVKAGGKDELGELGRSINHMLEQLLMAQTLRTEREALQQSERQHRLLVEHAPMGVLVLENSRLKYVNKAARELIGLSEQEAPPPDALSRFLPELDLKALKLLSSSANETSLTLVGRGREIARQVQSSNTEILRSEQSLMTMTGEPLLVEVVASTMAAPFQNGIQIMVQDISQRKEAEARLSFMAFHDPLTGLPNRYLYESLLEQALARARRQHTMVACVALDIDRFKNVNDAYGHHVGDGLLVQVAQRLKDSLRASDVVCRVSGDEFLLILPDLQVADDARRTAQRLIQRLRLPCSVQDHELFVTPAIGIAVGPDDGNDCQELIRNAEIALFRSKGEGGNSLYIFDRVLGEARARRRGMEYQLRKALERDELFLMYQPQVDVKTHQVVGAESLLRWQHPELGLVSPAQFIPVAEESGLIIPITEWVLRAVCRQILTWESRGLGRIRVAVNISPRHISPSQGDGLLTQVKGVLREFQILPELLELEVTESVAMHNLDNSARLLNALDELGVLLSIDDFGTGYSSLGYLRRFPIHALKIDQSFVREVATNRDSQAIVETILVMSRSMGLTAIAEGVETTEQLDFLHERGCEVIQGYHFSRPLLPQAFESFVLKQGAIDPKPSNPHGRHEPLISLQ